MDPIKDLFNSYNKLSPGVFIDEQDFANQLSKDPKGVYDLAPKGFFLDYADFENLAGLKKKIGGKQNAIISGPTSPSLLPSHETIAGLDAASLIKKDDEIQAELPMNNNPFAPGLDMSKMYAAKQSRLGKTASIVRKFTQGVPIPQDDVTYLQEAAPTALNDIVSTLKFNDKNLAPLKSPQEVIAVNNKNYFQRVQDQVQPELKKSLDASTQILINSGFGNVDDIWSSKKINDYIAQADANKRKEIEQLEIKYPKVSQPEEEYYRPEQEAYNKELNAIEGKYAKLGSAIGELRAAYLANGIEKDPFKIGMEYLKYSDPIKYKNRIKAGSETVIDNSIAKKGNQIRIAVNQNPLTLQQILKDDDFIDDRFTMGAEQDVLHRLAAEHYKESNKFWYNPPTIQQLDDYKNQLPAKEKALYERTIRPRLIAEGMPEKEGYENLAIRSIFGYSPEIPISGGLNAFTGSLFNLGESTGKGIAGAIGLRPESDKARELINNPMLAKTQGVGQSPEAIARINDLNDKEKKGKLSLEELNEREDLKSYTNVVSSGEQWWNRSMALAGQVVGQALLTRGLGGALVGGASKLGILAAEGSTAVAGKVTAEAINASAAAAVGFASSIDDASKQGMELGLYGIKNTAFSTVVGAANAVTENIFKDTKVLDAFNKEIAQQVLSVVEKLGVEGMSRELFQNSIKAAIKNAVKYTYLTEVEAGKEVVEETATTAITQAAIAVLAPDQFSVKNAANDIGQTIASTFLDGQVVAAFAGLGEYMANKIGISTLSKLGIDKQFTTNVYNAIDAQLKNGALTEEQAKDKKAILNNIAMINSKSMPEVKKIAPKLSDNALKKYAVALAYENSLKDKKNASNDEALNQTYDQKIQESVDLRKAILAKQVFIDDKFNVYATQESNISEGLPESRIVQPTRTEKGQPEAGQGEGTERQGTQQEANVSNSTVSGKTEVEVQNDIKAQFPFVTDADFVEETYTQQEDEDDRNALPDSGIPTEQDLKDLLDNGEYAILSGQNPSKTALSKSANKQLNDNAVAWLKARGLNAIPVFGKYGNSERSFLVPKMTQQQAIEFAKEFQQEAVAHNTGMVYPDGTIEKRLPGVSTSNYFDNNDDNYTTVNVGGKNIDFKLNFDFGNRVPFKTVAQKAQDFLLGTKEGLKRNLENLQKALRATGIKVLTPATSAEYDEMIKSRNGQERTEGMFFDNSGEIILNMEKLAGSDFIDRVIWHEGSHPVLNILRNTNPKLYQQVLDGLKELAKTNPGVANALQFAEEYRDQTAGSDNVKQAKVDDEFVAESAAMMADGTIDLDEIPDSILQKIFDFFNEAAKLLGIKGRLYVNDKVAAKKILKEISDALTQGQNIASVVGKKNVKEFKSNLAGQASIERKASELPMSASNILYADSDVLPKPAKKIQNYDVAKQFEKIAQEYWGGDIVTSQSITEEQEKLITENGIIEAIEAFKASGKNAADWYSTAIEIAVAIAGVIHPELNSVEAANKIPAFAKEKDPVKAAQMTLRMALAITSQNLNVDQNTKYAEEQFNYFLINGEFDPSKEYGGKAPAISSNLELANLLIEKIGLNEAEAFISKDFTVKELEEYFKEIAGDEVTIVGLRDDAVNGAAIFGPKIGQGFLQNLMGKFDPVTIDLWMRRTWGRWTGDVVGEGITEERMARLYLSVKEAVKNKELGLELPKELFEYKPVKQQRKDGNPYMTMDDKFTDRVKNDPEFILSIYNITKAINLKGDKFYKAIHEMPMTKELYDKFISGELSFVKVANKLIDIRAAMGVKYAEYAAKERSNKRKPIPKGEWIKQADKKLNRTFKPTNKEIGARKPEWASAAKVIQDDLNPIDTPTNSDRKVITRIVQNIRKGMSERGYEVTNADVQALLWYPEKDIWAKLRGEKVLNKEELKRKSDLQNALTQPDNGKGTVEVDGKEITRAVVEKEIASLKESNLKTSYDEQFIKLAEKKGLGEEANRIAKEIKDRRSKSTSTTSNEGAKEPVSGQANRGKQGQASIERNTIEKIKKENPEAYKKIGGTEFYHGTSLPKNEEDFTTPDRDKGVGVRSNAFMGTFRKQKSPFFFITSEKNVAQDFASSKKDYVNDETKPTEKHTARVIPFRFDEKSSNVLDLSKDDYEFVLQKIGEDPIEKFGMGMYEQDEMWQYLDDKEFADKLKELKFDAVKFLEPKRGIGIAVLNTDKLVHSSEQSIADAYNKGNNPELNKQVDNAIKPSGQASIERKLKENKTAKTQTFFSNVVKGENEKYKPKKDWQPLMKFRERDNAFNRLYSSFKGNFDTHIATSIPGFRDVQVKKGVAMASLLPKGGLIYDIGGSEGGLIKAITKDSGGKIKSINVDVNEDMQKAFNQKPVAGSTFVNEAFLEPYEENGKVYPAHQPKQKADIVHESMVFQFISPEREQFIDEIADKYIKKDGVVILEEKVQADSDAVFAANEKFKDDNFKLDYYDASQLDAKREEVLTGMKENQTQDNDLINALKSKFEFVSRYWDSGNFKGYVASNDKAKVDKFMKEIGNTDTKFTTKPTGPVMGQASIERKVKVESQELLDIKNNYVADNKITTPQVDNNKKFTPEDIDRIAKMHDDATDDRKSPEVIKTYEAFMDETKKQYELLVEQGYKIEPWLKEGEPYGVDSSAVREDVNNNKHLFYLRSKSATGVGETDMSGEDYILFRETGIKLNGDNVLYNDLFRAVHDILGHCMYKNSFSTQGEFQAYLTHSNMFSEDAQSALFLETVSYNAYYSKNKEYAPRKMYVVPQEEIANIRGTSGQASISREGQASISRIQNNKNFKLAAFVMRMITEGASKGEIGLAIASIYPTMDPNKINALINNPDQFIKDSFPGLSDDVHNNIIERAKVQNIYRDVPANTSVAFAGLTVPSQFIQDAENRRKNKKKIFSDSVKDFRSKWLNPNRGLPDWVLAVRDAAKGTKDIEIARATKLMEQIKSTAKKIGFTDWDAFEKALKDVNLLAPVQPTSTYNISPAVIPQSLQNIPSQMVQYAIAMRAQVDRLTRDLIGSGYVTPEQGIAIEKNIGTYFNRAYKMFTEKDYKPTDQHRLAAVQYLADQKVGQIATDNPTLTLDEAYIKATEEAQKDVAAILNKKKNPYFNVGSSESRNTGILKERKDIPEVLRNLMGEYTDAGTVFIMTVAKQASLKAQSEYLTNLRTLGMNTLFYEGANRPIEYSVQIASTGSEAKNPLGGLWTTPEIAEILESKDPTMTAITNTYLKAIGAVKWGKTVGSIITQCKNFESNLGFALMNGLLLSNNKEAFGGAGQYVKMQFSKKDIDAITEKCIKLGLVGQSIGIRELKDMLGSGNLHDIALDYALDTKGKFAKNLGKKLDVVGFANKLYRMGDDFWKVYAYLNERQNLSGARYGQKYEDLTPKEQAKIDIESSERVKNTWPTYDRVVDLIKTISKSIPILGNFVSFQAESVRVLNNTVKLAISDMKDPELRVLGAKRLVGIMSYVTLRTTLTYVAAQAAGIAYSGILSAFEDDEEKRKRKRALNAALPFYMRPDDPFIIKSSDPAKFTVYSMSSLDPYGIIPNTMNAFTNGSNTTEPGATAAVVDFFSNFLEPEMTFQTANSVYNNRDLATGKKIYNTNDDQGTAIAKTAEFIFKRLTPSTISTINRVIEKEDKRGELLGFLGARPVDVNLNESFGYKLSNMRQEMDEIASEYYAIKLGSKYTEEEKEKARQEANTKKANVNKKYHQLYDDYLTLGASKEYLDRLINEKSPVKATGFDAQTKYAIITGIFDEDFLFK